MVTPTDRSTERANIVQSAFFEGWKIEGRDLQLTTTNRKLNKSYYVPDDPSHLG